MFMIPQSEVKNRLLRRMRPTAFMVLSRKMERIDLALKDVLVEANQMTSHVCFIESGLASVIAESSDAETVEVGHVGREGMTGYHVLLMTETSMHRTFMQTAGSGIKVPVHALRAVFAEHPAVRDMLLRYVQCCETQLAHLALANARYSMHERLARWLLMCHDRLDGDDLPLTHEFLSLMLGVRRSGVTDQLHILEGLHAIRATRGNIRIVNRAKLEDIAGGSYGLPEAEYRRLIETPDGAAETSGQLG
ncbi:Crp/Fnr family transcriptional regulator [Rhizobium herbae]|uniref:Crp/Fnr family transcriptional regulator n=1 Tax=Rhizobium herbae TaxID=508661 RepID=A0ABS7HB94_9HYPH|nr:Crp/Fnr family transcriptional regulator [Rhizobium herbae]MBW9064536.1 Crp/Fnr family transcriptional regulator [Rhizobium herbae]